MILVKLSKESCSVNCIYSPCFGGTRILQSSLPSSCLPSLRDCHAGSQELGGITSSRGVARDVAFAMFVFVWQYWSRVFDLIRVITS